MSEVHEAKSLRWLANQFPFVKPPKNEVDKMQNAIHVYASRGADKIDELSKRPDLSYLKMCEVVHEIGPYKEDEVILFNSELISPEDAINIVTLGTYHPAVLCISKDQWNNLFKFKECKK